MTTDVVLLLVLAGVFFGYWLRGEVLFRRLMRLGTLQPNQKYLLREQSVERVFLIWLEGASLALLDKFRNKDKSKPKD